jgi:hypothetical protein
MYAKFAGAPPNTFPDGKMSHNTSPNPIMSAGFVINPYQWLFALPSLPHHGNNLGAKSARYLRHTVHT